MAQNPQLLLAQQNVARICQEGIESANAICHDLMNPVEVPLLGSDAVSCTLLQYHIHVYGVHVYKVYMLHVITCTMYL